MALRDAQGRRLDTDGSLLPPHRVDPPVEVTKPPKPPKPPERPPEPSKPERKPEIYIPEPPVPKPPDPVVVLLSSIDEKMGEMVKLLASMVKAK